MRSICVVWSLPMPIISCCSLASLAYSISSSSWALNESVALGMTRPMALVTSLRNALAA